MENNSFHTFNEYMKKEENTLTASMEDYLEMIYRLSLETGVTRMNQLSESLHVQPPSATKMVQKLGDMHFLKYERYGYIVLEESGRKMGELLLRRHNTIEELLKIFGVPSPLILEETEKIEHTISGDTIKCFETFIDFVESNVDILTRFNEYKNDPFNDIS